MEHSIEIFEGLRVKNFNGEILINLEDISRGLGFTRIAKSGNETIRWERVNKYLLDYGIPISGHADTMVAESVFYLLAMKANNQTAKEFQVNVATKIIPEYRKKITSNIQLAPTNFKEALLLAYQQQEVIEEQSKVIQKLEPRSLYFDKMINTDGLVSMQEVAKLLNIQGMGRTIMMDKLRQGNVFMKGHRVPYQHFVNKGYFELKEDIVMLRGGVRKVNVTTYATQKGLAFIFKFFGLTKQ